MKNPSRNLLMLLKNQSMSQQAIEQEVECLNEILFEAESPEHFYIAHELVDRNRITSKPDKILKAVRYTELKPFPFFD